LSDAPDDLADRATNALSFYPMRADSRRRLRRRSSISKRTRNAVRSVVAIPSLVIGLGCATAVPYYGGSPVVLPAVIEAHRAGLVQELVDQTAANGIVEVHLVDEERNRRVFRVEGAASELREWPLAALEAAAYAAAWFFGTSSC
jgi:hypothetical protein